MRTFPKPGFYCLDITTYPGLFPNAIFDVNDCIYVTGTCTGNKYRDVESHGEQWNKLTWTCIPGIKEINQHYRYFSSNPTKEPI